MFTINAIAGVNFTQDLNLPLRNKNLDMLRHDVPGLEKAIEQALMDSKGTVKEIVFVSICCFSY
jgi:hypothetical protein